jgi:RNA polymerase sigma factor (sigma-70 family)
MDGTQTAPMHRLLRKMVASLTGSTQNDGTLLEAFLAKNDQDAFASIVRRHGPMVSRVCRGGLSDFHSAEDAFQATFILLAQCAGSIRKRESLASWLHGVAFRMASDTRRATTRRRKHELHPSRTTQPADPAHLAAWQEIQTIMNEEIQALPCHYREPFIRCCLELASCAEVASQMGLEEATIKMRLSRARKRLQLRLSQRGVSLTAVLGALTVVGTSVPDALASSLVGPVSKAAAQVAASKVLTGGLVSTQVISLVEGVKQTMFLSKLYLIPVVLMVVAIIGIAVGGTSFRTQAETAAPPGAKPLVNRAATANDEKKPQPTGSGKLLLARQGGLIALTPEGKEGDEQKSPDDTNSNFDGRLSPDGKWVAFLVTEQRPPAAEGPEAYPYKLVIRKLDAKEPLIVDVPTRDVSVSWTADGARVVLTKRSGNKLEAGVENLLVDPTTGKTEPLALPEGAWVLDCGRDGKTFLVVQWDGKKGRIGLAAKGDKEVRVLAEVKGWTGRHVGRLSPDGKQVLYTDADPAEKDANRWGTSAKPYLLDVATKKREELADFPASAQCVGVAWSPDGKRVAYTWHQLHAELLKKDKVRAEDVQIETEAFLVIADANGRNAKTVSSAKLENAVNPIFGSIDWR